MSRGFVKEGDQEEPPMIPPRAALPDGVTNYVTPEGLKQLETEKEELITERSQSKELSEREKRRKAAEIEGKLNLLTARINSARVLNSAEQQQGEVRFGAIVTYQLSTTKNPITLKIVGVDEANIREKKVGFIAPLAKAMIGKKIGDQTTFDLRGETRQLEIIDISY